jgi:hypothetical protein
MSLRLRQRYAKSGAMPTDAIPPALPQTGSAPKEAGEKPPRSPAAERALAEAAARHAAREHSPADQPKETGGRDGPEPTRYGDWEVNGITSDF